MGLFKTKYGDVNEIVLGIVPESSRSLLDLGCGTGCLGAALKKRFPCVVTGVTNSREEAEEAKHCLDKVILDDLNTCDLSLLGEFDCIICSHILEHLYDPWGLLGKLRNNLVIGGALVVALPNAMNWRQRVQYLVGDFNYAHMGLMDRGHIRFFSRKTAIRMIEDAGYEIMEEATEGRFPLPLVRNIFKKLDEKMDGIAAKMFPGLFGVQFVFLAKKSKSDI